jgi:hypothetical protein
LQNRKKVLGQIGLRTRVLIAAFCAGFCISGGIGGPLLVGLLLGYHLSAASLFYAAAVPMLLAGTLVTLLGLRYGVPRQRQPVPL